MQGFLTLHKLVDFRGREMSTQRAVDLGLINPTVEKPAGWGIEKHEIPVGFNMNVDNARQYAAYLCGGRTPIGSFVISRFGIGTNDRSPNSTDTELVSPVNFYDDGSAPLKQTKPIDGADYPAPFIVRFEITLGADEANGVLIREWGLYAQDISSGVTTLMARKIGTGYPKNSDLAPTWVWRIRT